MSQKNIESGGAETEKVIKPKKTKKTKEMQPAEEPVAVVLNEPIEAAVAGAIEKFKEKSKKTVTRKTVRKKTVVKKAAVMTPKELVQMEVDEVDNEGESEEDIVAAAKPVKTSKQKKKEVSEAHNIEVPSEDYLIYNNKQSRPIGVYKKIAFAFVFLTVALLAAVFYFAFVKINITLIPNKERVSNNLIFDIYDKEKNQSPRPGVLVGVVKEIEVSESKTFEPSTAEVVGEEVVGKVTIINKYNKSQPLVATTRFLSSDNKLFRLKEGVTVAAGGSVEAEIYADKPSESMAIKGASSWTIPGLWAGLQDKIYAESKDPMEYRKKTKKIVSQADIDKAMKDWEETLKQKARTALSDIYQSYNQVVYDMDDNSLSVKVDAKVGEEKSSFTVEMRGKVDVVAFNDGEVIKLAEEKINSTIPENKELVDFQKDKIVYSLNSSNLNQGVATVNATFEGKITLKKDAVVVEKDKIVGLSKDQLTEYLSSMPELAGSEVKFYPSFISKVPDLVDRINITIKE